MSSGARPAPANPEPFPWRVWLAGFLCGAGSAMLLAVALAGGCR